MLDVATIDEKDDASKMIFDVDMKTMIVEFNRIDLMTRLFARNSIVSMTCLFVDLSMIKSTTRFSLTHVIDET
jgi:hypothetical protein